MVLLDVVLVPDVADQLLDQVLQRDDAGRAAVLVHHDGQVGALAAHLGQRGEHGLADRQVLHRPADLADRDRVLGHAGAEQVPHVHEADHVVVGVLVDRQPRVGHARDDGGGLGHLRFRVQEDHLGARHEHLADLPLPGVEDLADDVPLVLAERLGAGHQVTQFLLGNGLAADPRIAAEQGDDQVGALGQQPDHRPGQHGDPVQQRRRQQGQRGRALQRDPLGC